MRKRWGALEPGDIIDIVAPASASAPSAAKQAIRFVERMGFEPRFPEGLQAKDLLCSNTDERRFHFLKKALQAKDSKAIWCLRGGYGSMRILSKLDQMRKPLTPPKLFIGYSDITAIHNFLNQQWGWPTLHGTMLEELGRGEGGRRELQDFRNILFRQKKEIEFASLKPMNTLAQKKDKVLHSSCCGGNLAILAASLGTPWQFSAKGKILLLEDIGERGYRVDRMLVQLHQAGVFKGVRALIFGDFVGGQENRDEDCVYLWKDVQKKFAEESSFPVFQGLPFGHGPFQRPIPLNTPSRLELGRRGRLIVQY